MDGTKLNIPEKKKPARLKILYIAGNGRSGSALIDNILGQLPNFTSIGEVRQIWDEGIVENRLCGCGEPVQQCEIWSKVLQQLASQGITDGQKIAQLRENLAQTKQLVPMFINPQAYKNRSVAGLVEFLDVTLKLYQAIAQVSQCNVIVDSSKWPTYSFLLSLLPEVDVHILHLVHDPRACAFSWNRGKEVELGRLMGIQSAIHSTAYWSIWNPATNHLWKQKKGRYHFLRYEDFIDKPQQKIHEIVDFLGEKAPALPLIDDKTVSMAKAHAISGNPSKFNNGSVRLTLDNEWRHKMSLFKRIQVNAMTWPLLWKYGYLAKNSQGIPTKPS